MTLIYVYHCNIIYEGAPLRFLLPDFPLNTKVSSILQCDAQAQLAVYPFSYCLAPRCARFRQRTQGSFYCLMESCLTIYGYYCLLAFRKFLERNARSFQALIPESSNYYGKTPSLYRTSHSAVSTYIFSRIKKGPNTSYIIISTISNRFSLLNLMSQEFSSPACNREYNGPYDPNLRFEIT